MDTGETPSSRDYQIKKFLEGDTPEIMRQKLRLALDLFTKEQLVSFVHEWAASLPKEELKASIHRMLELDGDEDFQAE